MKAIYNNISLTDATAQGYTLQRGQEYDGAPGLYRYTLTIHRPITTQNTIAIVYCHRGTDSDSPNAAIGTILSTPRPLAPSSDQTDTQTLRQMLLPLPSLLRTPQTVSHAPAVVPFGDTGQQTDPAESDYNAPLATIDLHYGPTTDSQGTITTTLHQASLALKDYLSLCQTAEGATVEIHDRLIRYKDFVINLAACCDGGSYAANADSAIAEIENLQSAIKNTCQTTTSGDIHTIDNAYDILLPIRYGDTPIDIALLRIAATWGKADGEFIGLLDEATTSLQQMHSNGALLDSERKTILIDQILPLIDEMLIITDSQGAHLGACIEVALSLDNLCQNLVILHQEHPQADAHHYAERRNVFADALYELCQRETDLLAASHNAANDHQSLVTLATESQQLAQLHHLIIDWHQQFYTAQPQRSADIAPELQP